MEMEREREREKGYLKYREYCDFLLFLLLFIKALRKKLDVI